MQIQTDQVTALRQTAEKTKDTQGNADAFASLLAKETGGDQTATATGLSAPPLSGCGILGIPGAQEIASTEATGQLSEQERSVMENMNSVLTKWEKYADQLAAGSGDDSLKQAYGVLENIESDVKQLKNDLPENANAGLGSMVNELEVMTVTEKIKFNRGDYL